QLHGSERNSGTWKGMPRLSSPNKGPDEKIEILLRQTKKNVECKAEKEKQTHG
ncbi:MAG: hypothetical protein RIR94_1124, partial [Bacteroidota bacterium]